MRIGIDVGGTNTDAVLMDGDQVVASCKKPTTSNVSDGIVNAIGHVLKQSAIAADQVQSVMIGTTHFTNAFVERKKLLDVGVIRVALPSGRGVPPLTDWPEDILSSIGDHRYMIHGGYQYDGRINAELDELAIAEAARDLKSKGIKTVAITSLFSIVNSDIEERSKEIVLNEMGDVSVSLSHNLGSAGLLERENASVMNASLADISTKVVQSFHSALKQLGISAPFFISQNDGTLMNPDMVEQYPVLTFASGPTNSMRGAAYLSGLKDALVADIGGTTTDIGMLLNGFPRESSLTVDIGGVRTNFRMPDVLAIGLGGGSLVDEHDGSIKIGPQSVGYQLLEKSQVFGGDTLTASDLAVAAGYADFGDKSTVSYLSDEMVNKGVERIHSMIAEGVDRMKTSAEPVPLILVGGGSVLVNQDIEGTSKTLIPDHAGVANAIGASIAQVSGEVDSIFSYDQMSRDEALDLAKKQAVHKAVKAGALESTVDVINIEETPLPYTPGGSVRVRIKVAGDLNLKRNRKAA